MPEMPRNKDDDDGAVAIEFAMIAMLLFILLFGIISFAIHFSASTAAAQAAAEGARASVAGLSNTERNLLATNAARAVLTRYGGMVDVDTATITAGPDTAAANRYAVRVQVDISKFNLSGFTAFLPALTDRPSSTVSIQIGGF